MDETDRAEQLLDVLDPMTAVIDHTDDLRAIAHAADALAADEARLTEAVQIARARPQLDPHRDRARHLSPGRTTAVRGHDRPIPAAVGLQTFG